MAGASYCRRVQNGGRGGGASCRPREPCMAVSGVGTGAQLSGFTSGLCGEFMCDFDTLLDQSSFLLCQMGAMTVLRDKAVVRIK